MSATDKEESGQFQPTRWAVVLSLREKGDQQKAGTALEMLCRDYWYPLYAFARRRGYPEHDAQDITQGFFGYLLEKDLFAAADPALGKLRTFLLTAFTRYMSRERDAAHAQKRGGGRIIESLDEEFAEGDKRYRREPADSMTPERLFARSWAQSILKNAKAELLRRESAAGRAELLKTLDPFLEGAHEGESSYKAVAEELGMTQVALRKTVSRLRERYRQAVRDQIASTLTNPSDEEVDREMQALWGALNTR